MRCGIFQVLRLGAIVAIANWGIVSAAYADDPPISMAGKRISIVVGSPVGGGYDAYGRLVGRHLGQMIEGNPGVVVQNMPGAGSLTAANWLANAAPKDGTALAILPTATLLEALFGNDKARFDARKMNWLGNLNGLIPVAVVWSQSPFKTAKDLLTQESVIGASDAGTSLSRLPKLLNLLIGTKFKVIDGYNGSAGVAMAMERGEVQGQVGNTWDSIVATSGHWVRDKQIRVLMQMTVTRDNELPDVPSALEFAPPENRDVLELIFARGTYGKPFMAPPGVPAPIVAAVRQGFKRMVENPEFLRDAGNAQLPIQFADADEMTRTFDKIFSTRPEIVERAIAEVRKTDPQ